MARYVDEMITRFLVEGQDGLTKAFGNVGNAANSLTKSNSGKQLQLMGQYAMAAAPQFDALGNSMLGGVQSWMQSAAAMEQTKIAFTTLLGSSSAATKMVDDLKAFSAATPYEFPDMALRAKQLMAYGIAAEEIIPMLTDVGNAASAMGDPMAMERLNRAFGQMNAKQKVSAEEMKQISETGVGGWEMLAKALGKTVGETMKLASAGLIPASVGIAAIRKGMAENFGGGMEKQSKTLNGQLSTLNENLGYLKVSLGDSLIGPAKGAVQILGGLVGTFQNMDPTLRSFIVGGTLVGGVLAKGIGIGGSFVRNLNEIRGMANLAGTAKKGLEAATKADNIAEIAKTGTAKKEAEAIGGVAKSAADALKSKNALAKAAAGVTTYTRGGADASLGGYLTGGLGVKGLMGANAGAAMTGGLGAGAALSSVTLMAGTAVLGWEVGSAISKWLDKETGYIDKMSGKAKTETTAATKDELAEARARARDRLVDNPAYQGRAKSKRMPNGDVQVTTTLRQPGYGGQQIRDSVNLR